MRVAGVLPGAEARPGSGEVFLRGGCRCKVLLEVRHALHVRIHGVEAMLKNVGVASLVGIQIRRHQFLPVDMVEGIGVPPAQPLASRQEASGLHADETDAGGTGMVQNRPESDHVG